MQPASVIHLSSITSPLSRWAAPGGMIGGRRAGGAGLLGGGEHIRRSSCCSSDQMRKIATQVGVLVQLARCASERGRS